LKLVLHVLNGATYSHQIFFILTCGVRQGGVLSPYCFACFIDSLVDEVQASGLGFHVNMACLSILLYADDIIGVSVR